MISDALDGPSRVARVLKSTGAYVFEQEKEDDVSVLSGDYADPFASPKRPEGFRQKASYYAVCVATSIYNGLAFILCCLARWLGGKHLARDKEEDEVEEVDPDKPFSLEDLIDKDEWEPPRTDEGRSDAVEGYNYKCVAWFDQPSCSRSCGPFWRWISCPRGPSWRVVGAARRTTYAAQYWLKIYRRNNAS